MLLPTRPVSGYRIEDDQLWAHALPSSACPRRPVTDRAAAGRTPDEACFQQLARRNESSPEAVTPPLGIFSWLRLDP